MFLHEHELEKRAQARFPTFHTPLLQKSLCFTYTSSIYSYEFPSPVGLGWLFKAITELFTRSWVHQLAINHLTQSQTNLHIHPSSGPCDFCDVGYILNPLGTCVFSETEAAYHGLAIRIRRTEMSSAQGNTVGAY